MVGAIFSATGTDKAGYTDGEWMDTTAHRIN